MLILNLPKPCSRVRRGRWHTPRDVGLSIQVKVKLPEDSSMASLINGAVHRVPTRRDASSILLRKVLNWFKKLDGKYQDMAPGNN